MQVIEARLDLEVDVEKYLPFFNYTLELHVTQ